VLTNTHLEAAHDLSGWDTTRLDEDHVLVQARDLGPWYAEPRRGNQLVHGDVIEQARRDFGDMLLTPQRARNLGLDTKPTPSPRCERAAEVAPRSTRPGGPTPGSRRETAAAGAATQPQQPRQTCAANLTPAGTAAVVVRPEREQSAAADAADPALLAPQLRPLRYVVL